MKNTITLFAAIGASIGIIGIIEGIATLSIFQMFVCAGLVWGSAAFYTDAKKHCEDEQ